MTPAPPLFNLPAACFPIRLRFYRVSDTDHTTVVYEIVVAEPGPVYIPPLRQQIGEPVEVHVEAANGEDGWFGP